MKHLTTFFFFIFTSIVWGQDLTVNTLNADGKKHGYWTQYLDSNIEAIDSSQASFYGYEYFDNGKSVSSYRPKKWLRNTKLTLNGKEINSKALIILDGVFEWYNSDNQLIHKLIIDKGVLAYRAVYNPNGDGVSTFTQIWDYNKLYLNQTGSFFYKETNEKNEIKNSHWYGKTSGKWKKIKST